MGAQLAEASKRALLRISFLSLPQFSFLLALLFASVHVRLTSISPMLL